MSSCTEDIVTDSVPDAPRDPESLRQSGSFCNEEKKPKNLTEEHQENDDDSEPNTPPKAQNKSNSSKPVPPSGPNSFPNFFSSGASNVICISNASGVHVGNSFSINYVKQSFGQQKKQKAPAPPPPVPKSNLLKEVESSTVVVSEDLLLEVAEHVGKRWKALGEALGFSQGQMERIHIEHKHIGLKEVVYQLLLDWKQSHGAEAQVGALCRRLWEAGQQTAAERLATVFTEQH